MVVREDTRFILVQAGIALRLVGVAARVTRTKSVVGGYKLGERGKLVPRSLRVCTDAQEHLEHESYTRVVVCSIA